MRHFLGILLCLTIIGSVYLLTDRATVTIADLGVPDSAAPFEPVSPSSFVNRIRYTILDQVGGKLKVKEIETNRIRYHTAQVTTADGSVYHINVFDDALSLFYTPKGATSPSVAWQDFDFDGEVDFGTYKPSGATDPLVFDRARGFGSQHYDAYQEAYAFHIAIVAMIIYQ